LQEEVIRVWEAVIRAEVAHVTAVSTMEASAQEVMVAWESIAALVRDMYDWAALAQREARESVLRGEVKGAVALASARGDAEAFAWRMALL
jgi:hypothetical protein